MKKILNCLLILVCLVMIGCSCGAKSDPNTLKVSIYLGGYGQVWANTLAKKFMEENEGIKVIVEADPELQSEIPNRLQNGSDSDIFFSHGISWEKAAVQGYLTNLDDLYTSNVGNGQTFSDRLSEEFKNASKFNGHYYKVPWTNGVGGIVYNAKMFRDNGWAVPTTYEELTALCETIYSSKIKVDPTDVKSATIKPFVWSSETYYWDYVVFDWWAQLAGVDKINEYKKLESKEVFNPETNPEKYQAFQAWVDLVAKHPEYSEEDSAGKQYIAAQMDFVNGYAAMIPNAQWLESEMRDNIDENVCEMAIMKTPYLENAKKDNEGNYIPVNYTVGFGDSIVIPKSSKHKDLAMKFINFLSRPENCAIFTEKTRGVMLAFDYSNVEVANTNAFMNSVIDINTNSRKFNLYSQSLLVLDGLLSIEWAPDGLQQYGTLYNYYNNSSYIKNPSSYKDYDTYGIFTSAFSTISSNWNKWVSQVS